MSMKKTAALLLSGMTLVIAGSAFARADNAAAERVAADRLLVTWQAKDPVDVYLSDRMDGDIASAKLISAKDDDGRAEFMTDGIAHPYVLLRDSRDRSVVRVAERVLHLEQGSNFRDLGGYGAADGKTIRWGMIYRAGGSAMLTAADLAQVQSLGLRNLVDLRSDEERVLAPTKIDGVPYSAVGYSMSALAAGMGKTPQNGANLYRNFPAMLAPQLRIIFGMLKRQEGPLEYNCSAGQDRTGFVTAMILSSLGVPRETILRDYALSTRYRQPKYEMPRIDTTVYANNPVAMMFARFQDDPKAAMPQPLQEADGRPFLTGAFEEIDAKYGSVDAYLEKEAGVSKVDIAALRRTYLE